MRILADARARAAALPYAGVRVGILRAAERNAQRALTGELTHWTPPKPTAQPEPRSAGCPRAAQVRRDVIGVDGRRRQTQRRSCLRCRRAFDSLGPGNRMCDPCRARSAEASPYAV